jgi:large subunit ribosomal protein L17
MLRNLAASLFLTERTIDELDENAPKVKGRIITTLPKAKEVRPIVERCITIARRTLENQRQANELNTKAARGSDEWKAWRKGDGWKKWNKATAPVVAARRRVLTILGDRQAMHLVFDTVAPRFADRKGGYTRILRLAKPRLGDAGTRAILEFVGVRDRVARAAVAPKFDDKAEEPAAP